MASKCAKMPVGLTFEEASGMPSVYATAIHNLIDFARLLTIACFATEPATAPNTEKCETEGYNWHYQKWYGGQLSSGKDCKRESEKQESGKDGK